MKQKNNIFLIGLTAILGWQANAQTNSIIDLKLRTVSFTNLQGRVFENVRLSRADLDGITYLTGGGGGVCGYSNLSPALLENWNIPTNRIALAAERMLQRAEQNREKQILAAKKIEEQLKAKKKIAFDKGYHDGSRKGASDQGEYKPRLNKDQLDRVAKSEGSDFWVSPLTDRGTFRPAYYDRIEKNLQPDYLAGFKSGYAEGFKKAAQPAF